MTHWWLGSVVMAVVGAFAMLRAASHPRRDLNLLVAWHAHVAVVAFVAAAAGIAWAAALGAGFGALAGLLLIALGSTIGPRAVQQRHRPAWATPRLRIAAAWSAPLAVVVAMLLELAVAFPPLPVVFYVVVLTLVGSWLTDSDAVLSVGLRCAVALAAVAAFAVAWPRLETHYAGLELLATSAAWLGGAVLLLGSTFVRGGPRFADE